MDRATRAEAAATLPDRIAFLGLGLIGGSLALSIRQAGYGGTLSAWTPGGRGPAEGLARGVIDAACGSAEEAVEGAGLVILAGPPLAILETVGALGGPWRTALAPDATVTDVASTKARIVAAAETAGLSFVGGHPMAGRETTGVESAAADLFVDRPWVVVPARTSRPHDVVRVEALARAAAARPVSMAGEEHDAAVAAISHLPLLLSAALVEAVALAPDAAPSWPTARSLAASGWRDMTRLARGDADMGAGILATNRQAIADRLRTLRDVIDAWLERLEGGDGNDVAALKAGLEAARAALGEAAS